MIIYSNSFGVFKPSDILGFSLNKGFSLREVYLYRPSFLEWLILNIPNFAIEVADFYAIGKPTPFDNYFRKYDDKLSKEILNNLEQALINMHKVEDVYSIIETVAGFVSITNENKQKIADLLDKYKCNDLLSISIFSYSMTKNLSHPASAIFSVDVVYSILKEGQSLGIKLYEIDYEFPQDVYDRNRMKLDTMLKSE